MERKVGEIFTCDGKTYQVVKGITCDDCCILHDHCFSIRESLGLCIGVSRTDKTNVVFKEINNMEIKNNQLTIDIPEGMEIEKQPKFKDGDILSCDEDSFTRHTTLILHKDENITESIVSLIRHKKLVETNVPIDNFLLSRLYPAREDEKKELFDALAKGGKAWDAEKKIIVNLKHKCEFKPFDKVLGRNEKDDVWEAELFSHYREESQYPFRCIGFSRKYCIPYEGNEHLLGTTDNFE